MENIYVQFDGMVYQQIVGIPMGTNCAPLIADLFLYCYERDFMSDLQKSKRHDLIDIFNDTSRYLDDIFTIDNPELEKYIPDIYPAELQLNKANTSDKETSFLDLKWVLCKDQKVAEIDSLRFWWNLHKMCLLVQKVKNRYQSCDF